jgi:hypothetical protein
VNYNVESDEQISRFLRQSNQLRSSIGRPKFTAFMPPPSGRLSAYRTQGLSRPQIATLGESHVATGLKGHCELVAGDFYAETLTIESVPVPHVRHVDVLGWPNGDEARRIVAYKLADKAVLIAYPAGKDQ